MTVELNLSQIAKRFSDEAEAWKHIEALRWPDGPVCPHCGVVDHAYLLEPKSGARTSRKGTVSARRLWKCGSCRQPFSVLVGTIFEDSKIPLSKWILAFHLMCAGKNGVSAHELHRSLGITYKSAWFMAHRIRLVMERPPLSDKLSGIVEADETYVGGKAKGKRGRGALNKTPVVTLVERDGAARSKVMKKVTAENVGALLTEHVDQHAALMTDGYPVYRKPGKQFASHQTVDHAKGEYVRGDAHSNTVEGFFSQLKRSIDGTYHHVSERHLDRYLAEFDYRYSNRKVQDGERTARAVKQSAGKRLRYRQPTSDSDRSDTY